MRFTSYAVASTAACALAVHYAWTTRLQFYSAVIFLTTNKFSVLALGNMGLVLTLVAGRLAKLAFLGTLRDVELEVLYENSRFAVTETALALTIFREELSARVIAMFTGLLFVKAFHWLAQARVEHVEQSDTQRLDAHARLVGLMLALTAVDIFSMQSCISTLIKEHPSMLILFAFEFAALTVLIIATAARYVIHIVDMHVEGTWHGKNDCVFFVEFLTEGLQFVIYLVFFGVVAVNYGMPLHIIRDLWNSYATLRRRLKAYYRFRQLTANLNERFADATDDELAGCEHTCIICRDHMDGGKKLPCGHIYHFQCLRTWLQQQNSCPTCRLEIPAVVAVPAAAAAAAAAGGGAAAAAAGTAAAAPAAAPAQPAAAAWGMNRNASAGVGGGHIGATQQQGASDGASAGGGTSSLSDGSRFPEGLRRCQLGHTQAGQAPSSDEDRRQRAERAAAAAAERLNMLRSLGEASPQWEAAAGNWRRAQGVRSTASSQGSVGAAEAAAAGGAAAGVPGGSDAFGGSSGGGGGGASAGAYNNNSNNQSAADARVVPRGFWARAPIDAVRVVAPGGVTVRDDPSPAGRSLRILPFGSYVVVFERRPSIGDCFALRIPGGWISEFGPGGLPATASAPVPIPSFQEAMAAADNGFMESLPPPAAASGAASSGAYAGAAGFGANAAVFAADGGDSGACTVEERMRKLERNAEAMWQRIAEVNQRVTALQEEAAARRGNDGGDTSHAA